MFSGSCESRACCQQTSGLWFSFTSSDPGTDSVLITVSELKAEGRARLSQACLLPVTELKGFLHTNLSKAEPNLKNHETTLWSFIWAGKQDVWRLLRPIWWFKFPKMYENMLKSKRHKEPENPVLIQDRHFHLSSTWSSECVYMQLKNHFHPIKAISSVFKAPRRGQRQRAAVTWNI